MDLRTHVQTLTEAHGPSGYEAPIKAVLEQAWKPLVNRLETGRHGSLYGFKDGFKDGSNDVQAPATRPRIMVMAHMDENGLIVQNVRDGLLYVAALGGPDARILPGHPVIVHAETPLRGVVGVRPKRHVNPADRSRYAPLPDLFVDLGLPAAEVAALVSVGTPITLDAPLIDLGNKRVAGKALDDRSCIAAITVLLDQLQKRTHAWDVIAVGTVQEEMQAWDPGYLGAYTDANGLTPDLAIVLDVNFAPQAGVPGKTFKLGSGPSISIGANLHPTLTQALFATAKALDMSVGKDYQSGSTGTDAWAVQIAAQGIPTALINVPLRNMHTAVETVDLRDIERAGRLMAEFISNLDLKFIETLAWDT